MVHCYDDHESGGGYLAAEMPARHYISASLVFEAQCVSDGVRAAGTPKGACLRDRNQQCLTVRSSLFGGGCATGGR